MEIDFKHSLLKDQEENILIPLNSNKKSESRLNLDNITTDELQMQITYLRRRLSSFSFVESGEKQSTLLTALIICNNTLGSAVMILPIVFGTSGIFTSLIVMLFIGLVQFITCNISVIHLKENEPDFPQLIDRLLGKSWKVGFVLSSALFEILTGVVYFILMNNMLYPIIVFIFEHCGYEGYAEKSDYRYDVYSFQINAWILAIPCFLSCFLKNMNTIAVLSKIGIYVLCSYIIFLIYVLFDNFYSGNLESNFSKISYATTNITEISGAFCMAFYIHGAICPLLKNIKVKEETGKAVGISYILCCIFYFLIGLIGYLGIIGRETIDDSPQTIMDFFGKTSIFPLIIEVFYFFKLVTVYPLFCYISRTQFFSIIFKHKHRKNLKIDEEGKTNTYDDENFHFIPSLIYNILYMAISIACVLYNVNLTFIMGITGAIFGYFLVYIIPVAIHLKCYGFHPTMPTSKISPNPVERLEIIENNQCNYHEDKYLYSSLARGVFYFLIIIPFGTYLMVIQIMQLFNYNWN